MDRRSLLTLLEETLLAPAGTLNEDTPLLGLDGWDSIGALAVIAMMDRDCGITVDGSELWSCQTVGNLIDLVDRVPHAGKSETGSELA